MPISPGLIYIDDGDDESHWQDRVSSGFDRLVAFASTELTKSRRSIEDGAPSTSPDSGINQSSDGRTFLSSSSSSSQLDAPMHSIPSILPIMKTSPPAEVMESPPPSEMPRTPSPSSSPPPIIFSRQSPAAQLGSSNRSTLSVLDHDDAYNHKNHRHHNNSNQQFINIDNSGLKIPLKYQRQSKSSSQKHYKKKFRERTWEYDDYDKNELAGGDEFAGTIVNNHIHGNSLDAHHLMSTSPSPIPTQSSSASSSAATAAVATQFNNNHHSHHHHHHKSSKFRPKGKDWDWRSEHHRNLNHENDTAHA